VPDHRQRRTYSVAEIIMGGLFMFIFKRGSRNNADNTVTPKFENNFVNVFGLRLPIMDTVNVFLKTLPPAGLEKIKQTLVRHLVQKRVLDKYRYKNRYVVAVDGTGVFSFDYEPFAGCPYKTSKNGKKTWQVYVLEAKIVCGNKFSLSLATEWLCNSDNIDEKQDCEQKAFVRLAAKLRKMYPRLPMIIAADSLYPNNTVFDICKVNNWDFILTFKEGVLKSVWDEAMSLYPLNMAENMQKRVKMEKGKDGWMVESAMFVNNLPYKKHILNWVEYISGHAHEDNEKRFVHITNMEVNKTTVWDVGFYGRLRWKIENEGFNTQKNQGYNLQHKYCRKCFGAMQNYYQLLQIAHLINQLAEKLKKVKQTLKQSGRTIKSLWEDMVASMLKQTITMTEIQQIIENEKQLRY
jgi:hypothetical protein